MLILIFLLFFQEHFLMHSRRPDKDIESFVKSIFPEAYLKKKMKKIFFVVLPKSWQVFKDSFFMA